MSLFQVLPAEITAPTDRAGRSWLAKLRRRTFEVLERSGTTDRLSRATDIVLIVLISASVVAVVLESIDSLYARYSTLFYWFEVATVAIFTVEYVLRFWCSVECKLDKSKLRSSAFVRMRYMLTPSAIVDLIAIVPFYLVAGGLISPADMRFVRAIRLLRVLKLTRYSGAFDTLTLAYRENLRAFAAALFILIVVMLIAATGMYYFENDAQPEAFSSIPASMWWAFATLTTVGYGDVTPITIGGKVFGALITVVGVGMVALPTAILVSAYSEQLRLRSDEYRRQSDIAYKDGILTETEELELEALRIKLGLGQNTASQILSSEKVRAALRDTGNQGCCPHCGAIDDRSAE